MHSLLTSNELNEKEVTVWFCNVLQFTERINLLSRYLSPVELTRAKKFRFSRDRNRYIVQHAVLRLLLSNYIGCEARQVDIRLSTSGKPYLVCNNSDTICFNVSSSGTLAVFAFNLQHEVGTDIECVRYIPEMQEIIERHFTHQEQLKIFSYPEDQRLSWFYKFWARKEAVLKAQGDGLLRPLETVSVIKNWNDVTPVYVQCQDGKWIDNFWVTDVAIEAGYAAAVAARGPVKEILVYRQSF